MSGASADLHQMGVAELSAALRARRVSAVEAAQHHLSRIRQHTELGAFVALDEQLALSQARAADERLEGGNAPELTGVPIAHKDIFVTRDWRTTAGSKMLEGYVSPFDATVVERFRNAGMVTLGKVNLDEFAMGSANENSAYGAVKNPWDTTAVPGGSSGGSAAAVAATCRSAPMAALRAACIRASASASWASSRSFATRAWSAASAFAWDTAWAMAACASVLARRLPSEISAAAWSAWLLAARALSRSVLIRCARSVSTASTWGRAQLVSSQ